jgi:glycine/D-amino acid oxidase-like deaminating enzyme
MNATSDIVILGAGMAGLATAYHLAARQHIRNITILDEREPLGLTSSRGTMAYRNWFPGPGDGMVRLMNRSIDLYEEIDEASAHAIQLSRGGYVYLTAQESQIDKWRQAARDAAARLIGPFREHDTAQEYVPSTNKDWHAAPTGTDLITNPEVIRQLYPAIRPDVRAMLHVRRCGAFDAFALGKWLLDQAQANGAEYIRDRAEKISIRGNRIESIHLASGADISTNCLVVAVGPLLPNIARMLELELPIFSELHAKITFNDTAHVFPRYGDLVYWNDPMFLGWDEQERAKFAESSQTRRLLEQYPGGVHFLPKGTDDDPRVMGLWTYHDVPSDYVEEPVYPPHHAEIILHGLAQVVPGASLYLQSVNAVYVDGGYYCKTHDNRPILGPLPIQGAYVCGALSGYGIMMAPAAGELVSAHITNSTLPDYAPAFLLARFSDPAYRALLATWDPRSGQL